MDAQERMKARHCKVCIQPLNMQMLCHLD